MAQVFTINAVRYPNRLPDGLTNKSAIPANLCETITLNSCDIQLMKAYTFEKITTATVNNKTGTMIKLKDYNSKYFVKELLADVIALINTPLAPAP